MNYLLFAKGSGVLIPGLTGVYIVLLAIFGFQLFRNIKKGGSTQDLEKGTQYDTNKNPFYKQHPFYFIVAVTIAYIVALLIIHSDYRAYDPKKDGVPTQQTDSTRVPAENL